MKERCYFYIVKTKENHYKFGIEYTNINERLHNYRKLIPDIKLIHLISTNGGYLIGQSMLSRYKTRKLKFNNDIIVLTDEIMVDELITSIRSFINYCRLDHFIYEKEDIEKYNES
jgi:hypothetical protein